MKIHMTAPITNATFQAETYLINDIVYKKTLTNATSGSISVYLIDKAYHPCCDLVVRFTIQKVDGLSMKDQIDDLINNSYFENINKIENVTSTAYNSVQLKDMNYVIKGNVVDVFFDMTKYYLDERFYPLFKVPSSTKIRR